MSRLRTSCRRCGTRCSRRMRARTSRSCAARAAGSGTTRAASTSTSSPGSRSSVSATARRRRSRPPGSSSTGSGTRRTSTGRSRCCGSPRCWRSGSTAAGRSSATPARRPTRRRSRSRARRPGAPGSWRSRAGSTAGRSARSRRPGSRRSGRASGRSCPAISFARPNDVESLEAALAPAGDTALLLLEPVLGEGGVIPLEPAFAQAAAELALEVGALLCVDEVQAGMGRTGTFFAYEQLGITPDLITLAKGLANGLPIGALLAGERAAPGFVPGRPRLDLRRQPRRCRGCRARSSRRSTTTCSRTSARAAPSSSPASRRCRRARRSAGAVS